MRIVICGAGAIGSAMGGYLALAGHRVTLLARGPHAEAIRKRGLTLRTAEGEKRPALDTLTDPGEVDWSPDDVVFMTTKSQDTKPMLERMEAAPADTPVFCFQNGVRNEEWAAERFSRVYGGLVVFSVNFVEPGTVEHTRNDVLAIGRYPKGLDEVTTTVGDALRRARFRLTLDDAVMEPKWGKLLLNLNNAVYALADTWLQVAYTDPDYRRLLAATMREGLAVLRAAGIPSRMGPGEPGVAEFVERLERGDYASSDPESLPPERRTYPSTWQDVVVGRPVTEVDHFNGEIVRLGRQAGVPTPYNSALLEMMDELMAAGRGPGRFTLADIERRVEEKRGAGGG